MFHVENLSWDDGDSKLWSDLERADHHNRRADPCDDDYETTCPFVDMLPDESGKEDGSPLNFGRCVELPFVSDEIDRQILAAFKAGI